MKTNWLVIMLSGIILCSMLSGMCVSAAEETGFVITETSVLGDVDSDGAVTSTDARLVLQYYAGKVRAGDLDIDRADVDGDGTVNSTDARLILQYYAGSIARFPIQGKDVLTEERALKIKQDFVNYVNSGALDLPFISSPNVINITIGYPGCEGQGYFGTYNNCEVVVLFDLSAPVQPQFKSYTVAGYTITLPYANVYLLVHRENTFMELQTAYEEGIISQRDVGEIQWRYFNV